ncbi:sulfite exporter TauE/SafE family protein [Noviherbaspirillum saxi]|uniref:Probable membrane transporter protein n=1 Tax=Noviherbaspirillum saxi TaxID=2320863 RepID=A0A3A3FIM2_9BURK|nr:sulfite exporter TauE/SafE family protein [Noviherbaspirillum saxi]RJF95117.1 sulfite exporter TauE/SafE family protein [Noviherbaspirillum saxi]
MSTDLIFYALAIPAILLTGVSKSGFSALGGIAVPLMSLAIAPRQAAGIMLPILVLTDIVGLRAYYGRWDRAILRTLIPGSLLGILIGALSFGTFSEDAIRLLIGVISVLFVVSRLVLPALTRATTSLSFLRGTCLSGLAGFTSFVAHAGAPPVMMYLLPLRLEKVTYIATNNMFFFITNLVKLVPYALLGQLSASNLSSSLVLTPLVPLGVFLGFRLQRMVNEVWFFRIAQAGLLLTGLQLIWQGTRA